jgi:hypothetical protein
MNPIVRLEGTLTSRRSRLISPAQINNPILTLSGSAPELPSLFGDLSLPFTACPSLEDDLELSAEVGEGRGVDTVGEVNR